MTIYYEVMVWLAMLIIYLEIASTYHNSSPPAKNNYYRVALVIITVVLVCLISILKQIAQQ